MKTNLPQIGRDSLIYGIGQLAAKGIPFFMLPVLTRFLSPAEYGSLELLVIINLLIGILIKFGTDEAQTFFFFESRKKGIFEQSGYVSAVFQWRLLWGAFLTVICLLMAPFFNRVFFNSQIPTQTFFFAFSEAFFFQIMDQGIQIFRLEFHPRRYVFFNFAYLLLAYSLITIFAVKLAMGIQGYFLGLWGGALVGTFVSLWNIRRLIQYKSWFFNLWPSILRFGAPLVPAGVATYFLTAMDRWCIQFFMTKAPLGIYAVGAKFALLISFFVQIFGVAFMPHAMVLLNDEKEKADDIFGTLFRYYLGLGCCFVIILSFLAPFLVRFLTAPDFYESYRIVGILSFAAVVQGITRFSSLGSWKGKKTYLYSFSVILAALLNFILNILFIPRYGLLGASWATAISMVVLVVISFYLSQKSWGVKFGFKIASCQTFVCLLSLIFIMKFHQEGLTFVNYQIYLPVLGAVIILLVTFHDKIVKVF